MSVWYCDMNTNHLSKLWIISSSPTLWTLKSPTTKSLGTAFPSTMQPPYLRRSVFDVAVIHFFYFSFSIKVYPQLSKDMPLIHMVGFHANEVVWWILPLHKGAFKTRVSCPNICREIQGDNASSFPSEGSADVCKPIWNIHIVCFMCTRTPVQMLCVLITSENLFTFVLKHICLRRLGLKNEWSHLYTSTSQKKMI